MEHSAKNKDFHFFPPAPQKKVDVIKAESKAESSPIDRRLLAKHFKIKDALSD